MCGSPLIVDLLHCRCRPVYSPAASSLLLFSAKLKDGGAPSGDKSQPDKDLGAGKKSESPSPCHCACHRASDGAAGQPAVVDLTVSPCKDAAQPSHTASQHGEQRALPHKLNLCNRPYFSGSCHFYN